MIQIGAASDAVRPNIHMNVEAALGLGRFLWQGRGTEATSWVSGIGVIECYSAGSALLRFGGRLVRFVRLRALRAAGGEAGRTLGGHGRRLGGCRSVCPWGSRRGRALALGRPGAVLRPRRG